MGILGFVEGSFREGSGMVSCLCVVLLNLLV